MDHGTPYLHVKTVVSKLLVLVTTKELDLKKPIYIFCSDKWDFFIIQMENVKHCISML